LFIEAQVPGADDRPRQRLVPGVKPSEPRLQSPQSPIRPGCWHERSRRVPKRIISGTASAVPRACGGLPISAWISWTARGIRTVRSMAMSAAHQECEGAAIGLASW